MKKLFCLLAGLLLSACSSSPEVPLDVHHVDDKDGKVHISHSAEHSPQWTAATQKATEVCRDLGFSHAEVFDNLEKTDTNKIFKFECHDSTGRWH